MIRFFAARSSISGDFISLGAEDAAHMKSLRMRPAELFVVCDGEGCDYICRLSEKGDGPVAQIVGTEPSRGEPDVDCSVYIALAKGDRLDYAVQKSVEMGAYGIFLFPSARCVSVPGDISKKTARLQRIALETAKQCGRGRVPEVTAIPSFEEAIGKAARAGLPLFFYECEEELHLREALNNANHKSHPDSPFTISIVTGPEGGFEPFEAALAKSAGLLAVSLGPRILRCETAPVAALTVIMFHLGNL